MPRFGEGDHRDNRSPAHALDAPVEDIFGDIWREIWSRLFIAVIAEDAIPPDDQHLAHRLLGERVKGQIGEGHIGEEILGGTRLDGWRAAKRCADHALHRPRRRIKIQASPQVCDVFARRLRIEGRNVFRTSGDDLLLTLICVAALLPSGREGIVLWRGCLNWHL